jgi:hypothetical protein
MRWAAAMLFFYYWLTILIYCHLMPLMPNDDQESVIDVMGKVV